MGRYVLVLPVEEHLVGAKYDRLPFNCTVMPWFQSDKPQETVVSEIRQIADKTPPVTLKAVGAAKFGPNNDVDVYRISHSMSIDQLHLNLCGRFRALGVTFDEESWVGHGYSPHVTNTKTTSFPTGSKVVVEEIVLVVYTPEGQKLVVTSFTLAGISGCSLTK